MNEAQKYIKIFNNGDIELAFILADHECDKSYQDFAEGETLFVFDDNSKIFANDCLFCEATKKQIDNFFN